MKRPMRKEFSRADAFTWAAVRAAAHDVIGLHSDLQMHCSNKSRVEERRLLPAHRSDNLEREVHVHALVAEHPVGPACEAV
jgi:hypothetical protein